MFELLVTMLERLGMIVTIAFVLTRLRFFREMLYQDSLNTRQEWTAILFFGFFGIMGTYSGLSFNTDSLQYSPWAIDLTTDEAIANSRVIGIILAGLLGGFRVGIGAGLIAGLHRYTLGGFTAISCGAASIVAGIIAGAFYRKNKHVKLSTAFLIGALAETVQMLMILIFSKPFEQALTLVENIGIPMIVANGLGSALFLLIITNVVNEEEKVAALQAQKSLRIAQKTLIHLRKGMNIESATAVCHILYEEVNAGAIAITDETKILAHIGLGCDHHFANQPLQTAISKKVIQEGRLVIAGKQEIHCVKEDCPLGAVVIAPLKQGDKTKGTLKFYFRTEKEITNVVIELMVGLSTLLSNQLEVAEIDRAYQLAKEAEIKALQAQISPHFLFNSLNTIVSLIRIEPTKARKLLVSLSHFLRQNLTGTTEKWTTLSEELKHVKAYLAIEEARFVDKLSIIYDVEEPLLFSKIPPLTLQPLVENAVKHGIKDMEDHCVIQIIIKQEKNCITIVIQDNGKGIERKRLKELGSQMVESDIGTGIGLYNVNRRLVMQMGEESALSIESQPGEGTIISFQLPLQGGEIHGSSDKSSSRG